jgi:hypothetical protein
MKDKVVLLFKHRPVKTYGGVELTLHALLISATEERNLFPSRSAHLIPTQNRLSKLRVGLDEEVAPLVEN